MKQLEVRVPDNVSEVGFVHIIAQGQGLHFT